MRQADIKLAQWQVDKSDIPPLQGKTCSMRPAASQPVLLGCSIIYNPMNEVC